jgi:hypothetical protein
MALFKVTYERHSTLKQRAEVTLHAETPEEATRLARLHTQRPKTMSSMEWHNGVPEVISHDVLGVAPIVQRLPPSINGASTVEVGPVVGEAAADLG